MLRACVSPLTPTMQPSNVKWPTMQPTNHCTILQATNIEELQEGMKEFLEWFDVCYLLCADKLGTVTFSFQA